MFISIIIPIWNDEKLLRECLDSCLNQQLPREDFEIICVDDGSTDRTPEILREYAEQYQNITVITKQHGPQFGDGRTIGLGAARGEYIWFVDHDDIVAPNAVDELKQTALSNPDYERIEFPCYKFSESLTEEERSLMEQGRLRQNYLYPPVDWVVWSSIIRRSFFQEHHICPNSPRKREAAAFWGIKVFPIWGGDWVLIDECKDHGIKTFYLKNRALYHYRVHGGSATMDTSPEAVEKRATRRYNMVLYRGYRAWVQKQTYLAERAEKGKASADTAEKTVLKIRDAIDYLSKQFDYQWKAGIKQFDEKEVFLEKRPEEYPISFRTYWKRLSKKEKLLPHLYAYYFSYKKAGAKWFWRLSWPFRYRRKNRFLQNRLKKKMHKREQIRGISPEE